MVENLRSAPEMKDTKVIMMTALGQAEDQARGEKLGVVKYLVKSQVTLEDFARVVKEVLGPGDPSGAAAASGTSAPAMPSGDSGAAPSGMPSGDSGAASTPSGDSAGASADLGGTTPPAATDTPAGTGGDTPAAPAGGDQPGGGSAPTDPTSNAL
jgi:hypothetical protein